MHLYLKVKLTLSGDSGAVDWSTLIHHATKAELRAIYVMVTIT